MSSGLVPISARMLLANTTPTASSSVPARTHTSADAWTVSASSRFAFAPKWRATSTFTPLERPMSSPVNSDTRMTVEPTAPKAMVPANRPTTATSAMLNSTCSRFDKISGTLNASTCFPRGPVVRSFCAAIFLTLLCVFTAHQCTTPPSPRQP